MQEFVQEESECFPEAELKYDAETSTLKCKAISLRQVFVLPVQCQGRLHTCLSCFLCLVTNLGILPVALIIHKVETVQTSVERRSNGCAN